MTRRSRIVAFFGANLIGGAIWLGIGWEVVSIDHETRYFAFVKTHLTPKLLFRNYLGCDECDATYRTLNEPMQKEFAEFCRAKYGFEDPIACDAMYVELDNLARDKLHRKQ